MKRENKEEKGGEGRRKGRRYNLEQWRMMKDAKPRRMKKGEEGEKGGKGRGRER